MKRKWITRVDRDTWIFGDEPGKRWVFFAWGPPWRWRLKRGRAQ